MDERVRSSRQHMWVLYLGRPSGELVRCPLPVFFSAADVARAMRNCEIFRYLQKGQGLFGISSRIMGPGWAKYLSEKNEWEAVSATQILQGYGATAQARHEAGKVGVA